jgi:hypothetical protein
MLKSYLVIERGLAGEQVYHLQASITIGKAPESNIRLPHASTSRLYSLTYVDDINAILVDKGGRNEPLLTRNRSGKLCFLTVTMSESETYD